MTTEEMAEMAACAQNALETLQANEAEIAADIDRLELRLEIVRETIALLKGEHAASVPKRERSKKDKGSRKTNATTPAETFITAELEPEAVTP
jgi:hypothetical protein